VKLRALILVFLLVFGLTPLLLAVAINLPLVLERTALFYQRAYLLNLRADFRDLDQHLASCHEMIRLLAKLPEPGLILGAQGERDQIDLARARYTGWVNQILGDQRDIIAVLFLDDHGEERFWLARDPRTLEWQPPPQPPPDMSQAPTDEFVTAGLALAPGAVLVSRIRVDPAAGVKDPRRFMTLSLVSPIGGGARQPQGVVVMGIDVGGLAQAYRDTLWVNQDGSYLRPGQPVGGAPAAFAAFPGLAEIFSQRTLALWQGGGRQFLWVPMFATEDGEPLWVGRAVDPSPIENFRNALMVRVLSIIFVLVLVVLVLARWIARRLERFGQALTGGVGRILRDGLPLRLHWRGPREVRELGEQLTALSQTHAEHLRAGREHTAALERSNRYKSEFLANVSHELRTPLNSILLLSKMLAAAGGGLSEAQRRQAQVIHAAGTDLRTLIDDILDISRIEAGHVPVSLAWVDLPAVLDELMELVAPLTGDKPVALHLHCDPAAPARIFTDREKLRQILKNFLANAIKFTDRGSVTLSLAASEEPARPLAISVTDTGIGIAQDKQEIIFEAFQQADGSTRRRYGGTGLGLSISRELAKLLGARIEVRSAPGAGSCFTLRLPLSAQEGAAAAAAPCLPAASPPDAAQEVPNAPTAARAGQWVLIIDRDVPTLAHLAGLISAYGLAVQSAADLDEALETLREEPQGCLLVLLAARVSACETCDTIIRLLKENQAQAIAVAVIGDALAAAQADACRAAGALAFLPTPVAAAGLRAILRALPPGGGSDQSPH
jgi:signal transduction histidine kinase/CheY-like chemotaxis protein